ncbi:flagellar hook-length control protein FliK [Acidithiobacillus concretivorus]|uniref:Flagellar hook-length control protein FliK n=1 Tax=Acidithiobacillus concretivorus TaxID=3063952 RepID=A0ABS5ZQI3_9PROT|nr:flagellar hook-length control protein FliK [Acidithiobacillus concretivorus]MBU2738777.1 flagellar hook-length control protein FliK [Acidithiobacillus concretivorus]
MNSTTLETAYAIRVVETALNNVTATALSHSLLPGNTLSAKVLQSNNQQTMLAVAGKTLAFDLPGHWSAGQELQLTYLGGSNNPKFLLMSNLAAVRSDHVALSDTAQSLRDLVQTGNQATQIVHTAAMLAPNDESPAHIANFLQSSLQQSGVFYESHLAAWNQGQWTTQNLLAEPQNAGRSMTDTASSATRNAPLSFTQTVVLESPSLQATDAGKIAHQNVATYTQIADLNKSGALALTANAQTASLQILGQQIQVLNQQQFVWAGPLWPGQNVSWLVRRRDGDGEASSQMGEDVPSRRWDSTLILDMPKLGHVEARLQLVKSTLHLVLTADQAALLRAHGRALTQSLQDLGLQVSTQQILPVEDSVHG